jgi:two-component system response regulator AtoC
MSCATERGDRSLWDRLGVDLVAIDEPEAARHWLSSTPCDVVFADGRFVGELAHRVDAPVIALVGDAAAAVQALEAGAVDGLVGVVTEIELAEALGRASRRALSRVGLSRLIGDSAPMKELRATIARIAPHRTTVLISGESGTGKELVARAIHDSSPRAQARFVAINCAAIPPALLESELFGHKRGAFTDAVSDKRGLFVEADGGTLFLDEVGELPLALQSKLLRVLQESEVRPVGDVTAVKVDVRVIAATLRELGSDLRDGRFREDLYYRLSVLPLSIPPLRDRSGDIGTLVHHFALQFAGRYERPISFSDEAIAMLSDQSWPGNVRELENFLERMVVLSDESTIAAAAVKLQLDQDQRHHPSRASSEELSIKKATRSLEADLIRRALAATGGNRTSAARLLEISHRALLYKIKEYGIN